jgi:hypothetical protein
MKTYEIDGSNFSDYSGFVSEVNNKIFGDQTWGGLFEQLDDILRGGFGTPDNFAIRWRRADKSRKDLGYDAMYKFLQDTKSRVHKTGIPRWEQRAELAREQKGLTLFDEIIAIVRDHSNVRVDKCNHYDSVL